MRILIVGAAEMQLAVAARLRRLDEAAKITVIDEAGDSPGTAMLRRRYRIDLRPFTRFISADMGYSNIATLEDALTRHVYQEEFDKIINPEQDLTNTVFATIDSNSLDYYFDADIAAHLKAHMQRSLSMQLILTRPDVAKGHGRRVADEIYGRAVQAEKPMELQTSDVAGLKLALFGQTEKSLNAYQMAYIYSILPIEDGFLKLIYDDGGNFLGFAALGEISIVENCTNVLTTLVKLGGNIQNLLSLELSGSGNPFSTLGKIAQNVVEKRLFMAYADEIKQFAPSDVILLDVRHHLELMDYRIDGAINIPLEMLRESIYRLERTKEVITICGEGKESYLAARILMGHGFKTRHLTGGLAYARPIIDLQLPQFHPHEVL